MKFIKTIKDFLNENENLMNQILDKISFNGIISLNSAELKYLKQYSTNNIDPDLEKSLQVESGYVFVSKNKNISLLKFEYSESEEYEDGQIIHKGTVYFEDLEFGGEIYCDENGKYEAYEFNIYEERTEGFFEPIEDLTDYDDDNDGKIEKFLKNEVCPYLTYSF